MKKVYIASPYTNGHQALNVRKSMDAFKEVAEMGMIPFAPLLAHFYEIVYPMPYEFWMQYDLEWLESCDVLLRLPGESKGADIEVAHANSVGIPVVYSLEELGIWKRLQ